MSVERIGPLTHAQRRMWLRGYWRGQGELVPGWTRRWDLPEEPTVEACLRAVAVLAERHEILRTTFHLGLDGAPVQLVHAADGFRLPVTVAPLGTAPPPADRPALVGSRTERPWWSLLLECDEDRVRRLTLVFDHIISDGTGLANLRTQLGQLLGGASPDPPAVQPVDRAHKEQRRLRAAAGPREDPFRLGPQLVCPPQERPPAERRYLVRTATYPGLLGLVDELGAATGVSRSTVVLGAVTELLCRFGGAAGTNVASYLNHRVGRDTGVECQMRPVDVHLVRPSGLPVRAGLREVQRQLLAAYDEDLRRGPVGASTRARTNAERGAGATVPLFYNYQELPAEEGVPPVVGDEVGFTDVWEPWGRAGCLMLYVLPQGDDLRLDLDLDTWLVTDAQLAGLLRALPALLRAWAGGLDTAWAEVACTTPRTASTARHCTRGWYDEAGYRGLLGDDVRVTTEQPVEGAARERLVATGAAPVDPLRRHLALAAALGEHLDVLLPDEYHWPGGSWAPGERAPRPPTTPMEVALCAAVREATGVPVDDVDRTFVDAGIGVEEGPLVVEALARERIRGCSSIHFSAPVPLSAVARSLEVDPRPMSEAPVYLP